MTDRGIADFGDVSTPSADTLDLKVMNVEYTDGNSRPVIHVFGRDSDDEQHHVEVVGHYPSFYIDADEYSERVDNHYAVHHTETHDENGNRYENLYGEPLVRVYTHTPSQVGEMRDVFHETYEADVLYENRWLIDNDVFTGLSVDTADAEEHEPWLKGDMRVDIDDIEPLDHDETPSAEPKEIVVDIEVAGEDGVPDADRGTYPVSTIVAWDSHSEQYVGWLLHDDSCEWDMHTVASSLEVESPVDDVRTFEDESEMLYDFNEYIETQRPDVLTGWYSNDFDIPYLVNRCKALTVTNYREWSPLGDVYISRFEPVVGGVSCIDMLEAYKKTQIHNLKRKGLDDIAEKELGESKVDHELSHTEMWRQKPIEFLRYNKVDVELVHRIDREADSVSGHIIGGMLDNLRAVVGCSYSDPIGGNIDMMDMLFLRKAQEYDIVLPTAEKPEVGDYHGAYVYTPESGLHEHVVYPDYSSLYPNIMYQCNISPETLVGTKEDLEDSPYTEDDCVWTYIDATTPPALKGDVEASEERMERLFFLKPSVEEGFIRSVLDDIMGLADQYSGGMYAAVKRVRNSTYGVLGDSDSYNAGFRLFDWRLAEGTTLGGQKVLKEGGRVFADAVDDDDAEVIYGDTDSVVTTIPNAESAEDALSKAQKAAEETNEHITEYAVEQFGLEDESEARMEIEIESYARGIFFKGRDDGRKTDGIKKKYVQMEEWNDDDFWLDEPEMTITGFAYVRSDVADVTADLQYATFDALMRLDRDKAERAVKEHVERVIEQIMRGSYPLSKVGIPFGISQSLDQYGSTDRTPQPQYRGAKYANKFIYGGEAIQSGDKPFYYYVDEGQTGDLRATYDAHTKEDGTYVDAISVLDADDMPDGVTIDREKMVKKTIINHMSPIFRTLGWGTEWMNDAIEDAKEPEDYRDDSQMGLEEAF